MAQCDYCPETEGLLKLGSGDRICEVCREDHDLNQCTECGDWEYEEDTHFSDNGDGPLCYDCYVTVQSMVEDDEEDGDEDEG